ncbi:hypothetical protein [Pseudarthrobacter albicanus]|uniref:hypothetical protein n=1 Tax=Pseudarthrobacter albicanus TaxID=2823873 RepID=UPI001BA4875B|nr:hypothetical protein [Pseudarthrobacter albicanus]
MENNQDPVCGDAVCGDAVRGYAGYGAAAYAEVRYFEVTYWDTDCGRVRTEIFDDAAAAERFADRSVADEDGWAVVDPVPLRRGRAAA